MKEASFSKGLARRVADTVMMRYPHADMYPYRLWCYPQGFLLWGFVRLWEDTKEQKYLDYVLDYAQRSIDEEGNAHRFRGNSMDDIMAGSILVWAYLHTGDDRLKRACQQIRAAFDDYPRIKEGGFWHGRGKPQMWVDGVFMGQMFMTTYAAFMADEEDKVHCFDEAYRQLTVIYDLCRKGNTGLLLHAYCEDRAADWADQETGLSPEVWSEGLGWYALILAQTLELFPKEHTGRPRLELQYRQLMESLLEHQDKDSGLWYQVVDKGDRLDNWCDTSGSAMFQYAMLRGVQLGLLPAEPYRAAARKAYEGLCSKVIPAQDGGVDIIDACDGLCVQKSYDVYVNYKKTVNAKEAVAAVLWAAELTEFEEEQQ